MFTIIVLVAVALVLISGPSTFWIAVWPGTVIHEFMHWIVGLCLFGNPQSFKVWPRKESDGSQVLGEVTFANVGWWNALPIAIAPLLAIPIVFVACYMIPANMAEWKLVLFIWVSASALAQCWPSSVDWHVGFSSKVGLLFWGFVGYKIFA